MSSGISAWLLEPQVGTALAALADPIDRVARNKDHGLGAGILDHRLASQPRGRRQSRRPVEQIFLLLRGLGQDFEALLHDHVAGCAGAIPAARVFEMDLVAEQDVENRAGPAVFLEGRVGGVEFDHPFRIAVLENHAQRRHRFQWSSIRRELRRG